MQIYEITLIQEGLGTIAKTIGSDIKRAVTEPINKAKAVLNTPGALTSARGYQAAKDTYYQGLVGQLQQANLTSWAKNLASEWSKQPRPTSRAPVAAMPAVNATPTPKSVVKPVVAPAATITKPITVVAPNPGNPTAAEYAKLQQRIAAADAKQRDVTNEAFADLPGAKPVPGGALPASVTAKPPMKATPPLQSRYAQNFKTWAASKVADKSSGLGLADVEQMPGMSRTLNQALAKIVTTRQTPAENMAAVEQYLLTVGQAMQKLSAEQKATRQQKTPRRQVSAITPLSSILNPSQIDALKTKAKDPAGAREISTELGLI